MNYRDKLLAQMMICFVIFAAVRGTTFINNNEFDTIKDSVKSQVEKNYSIDEIKELGMDIASKIISAPAVLTSAVMQASTINRFSAPIDHKSTEKIQAVHAVYGGRIVYSGIDKDVGLCIRIRHEGKTSVYGNLDSINSITGERVNKGDIIGTFDNSNDKEFYYQLEDSVV